MSDRNALTVEVAGDLQQPLEDLAGTLQQSPTWIVNRALQEYLDRRQRQDAGPAATGSTASYIELTTREEQFEVL
jgi:predicted transcriptional regulator